MVFTLRADMKTRTVFAHCGPTTLGPFSSRTTAKHEVEKIGGTVATETLTARQERTVARAQRQSRAEAGRSRGLGGRYQG